MCVVRAWVRAYVCVLDCVSIKGVEIVGKGSHLNTRAHTHNQFTTEERERERENK